ARVAHSQTGRSLRGPRAATPERSVLVSDGRTWRTPSGPPRPVPMDPGLPPRDGTRYKTKTGFHLAIAGSARPAMPTERADAHSHRGGRPRSLRSAGGV